MNPIAFIISCLLIGCGANVSKPIRQTNQTALTTDNPGQLTATELDYEDQVLDGYDDDHSFVPEAVRVAREKMTCTKTTESKTKTVKWDYLLAFDNSGCAVVETGSKSKRAPTLIDNKETLLKLTNCEQVRPEPAIEVNFETHQVLMVEGIHLRTASEPLEAWFKYINKTPRIGLVFEWQPNEKGQAYRAMVVVPRHTGPIEIDLCYAPAMESN